MERTIAVKKEVRLSIPEILSLGTDLSVRIRKNSESIIEFMESAISTSQDSLIGNVDKIIGKINSNRKDETNYNKRKGFNKLLASVGNIKEKIIERYTTIVSELRKMENTVSNWKDDFKEINTILGELKSENLLIINELESVVLLIEDELKHVKNPKDDIKKEIKNHLMIKLNGISTQIATLQQGVDNILIIQRTNYNIYSKLDSVYSITIPIIEQQLATSLTTEHHRNVSSQIKYLENTQNELIKSSAEELIRAGAESIKLLGDNGTIDAIEQARKDIVDGVKMLSNLDSEKILELESSINKIRGITNVEVLENENQNVIEFKEEN